MVHIIQREVEVIYLQVHKASFNMTKDHLIWPLICSAELKNLFSQKQDHYSSLRDRCLGQFFIKFNGYIFPKRPPRGLEEDYACEH